MTTDARSQSADASENEHSRVIVSLTVFSPTPISELAGFRAVLEPGGGGTRYDIGRIVFDEPGWERRADALDSALSTLDTLGPVPREVLADEGTLVRLFITVPQGAETIRSSMVKKMADVNATLRIDA